MKHLCLIFFFTGSCFFSFSQQPTDSSFHKPSTLQTATPVDSKKTDSSSGSSILKSKINGLYKQLGNSPATHKYVEQLNDLKGRANNKYKKLDSLAHEEKKKADKIVTLKQEITNSLKTKNVPKDTVKSAIAAAHKKNDSLPLFQQQEKLKQSETQNSQEKMAVEYVNTGLGYMNSHQPTEAAIFFEKGLRAAQEAHSLSISEQALKGLSDVYAQKADVKKALFYYKQYIEAKDSILKLKTNSDIAELKSKYESEKKQREIQSLQLDSQQKKSELQQTWSYIEKQKKFIFLIVLALVLTVLLAITLFRQYQSKKKNNELLLVQNKKIEYQKTKLEESLIYTKQLQEALREDLDHYMQAALRKQMNPHFIFNSLNSIQSFILQNDKISANTYLSKFASLMRKVLENSQHRMITLDKEIEVLKLYIELEEQRFDNKFNCFWNIDKNIDLSEHSIPPLLLQPYVENAIWHGLLHKEGERKLTMSITKNEEQLICIIEDNGVGREVSQNLAINKNKSKQSLGTKITQKRIDLINSLNKSGITIQYHDTYNTKGEAAGTKVEIAVPVSGIFLTNQLE
jgi:hypothetical protein